MITLLKSWTLMPLWLHHIAFHISTVIKIFPIFLCTAEDYCWIQRITNMNTSKILLKFHIYKIIILQERVVKFCDPHYYFAALFSWANYFAAFNLLYCHDRSMKHYWYSCHINGLEKAICYLLCTAQTTVRTRGSRQVPCHGGCMLSFSCFLFLSFFLCSPSLSWCFSNKRTCINNKKHIGNIWVVIVA